MSKTITELRTAAEATIRKENEAQEQLKKRKDEAEDTLRRIQATRAAVMAEGRIDEARKLKHDEIDAASDIETLTMLEGQAEAKRKNTLQSLAKKTSAAVYEELDKAHKDNQKKITQAAIDLKKMIEDMEADREAGAALIDDVMIAAGSDERSGLRFYLRGVERILLISELHVAADNILKYQRGELVHGTAPRPGDGRW